MQTGHSAGQFLIAPALTREQDMSTASGTLVDEDEEEEDYKSPAIPSPPISLEEASWTEEGTSFNGDLWLNRAGHKSKGRSCSNTRCKPASSRPESKVRSHSRHGHAKFLPTAQLFHARKSAEKPQDPRASFDVYTAGIKDLLEALSEGTTTSVLILDAYLAQIDRHNDTLRAIVHLAPREQLYRLARRRDLESKLGRSRGPLHGIPILVK